MAHPGSIIYANPPGEGGWAFFYVVYLPVEDAYAARCRPQGGEPQCFEGSAGEVVSHLEDALAGSLPGDGEIPRKAARAIRFHVVT